MLCPSWSVSLRGPSRCPTYSGSGSDSSRSTSTPHRRTCTTPNHVVYDGVFVNFKKGKTPHGELPELPFVGGPVLKPAFVTEVEGQKGGSNPVVLAFITR